MGTSNSKSTLSNLPLHPQSKLSGQSHHSATTTTTTASTTNNKEDTAKSISEVSLTTEEKPKRFDPRLYRPLEVTVSLTIHDIQAHLVKVCYYLKDFFALLIWPFLELQ